MAKEHQIYWLSTEESGEDGVGRNWYYIKDARKQAQQLANELNTEVYINQSKIQEDRARALVRTARFGGRSIVCLAFR